MTLKRSATLPIFKAVKTGILKNTVFWDVEQRFTDDSEEHTLKNTCQATN
jgi:hypothetical protein